MRCGKELSGVRMVAVMSIGILNELVLCVDHERLPSARERIYLRSLLACQLGNGTSPLGRADITSRVSWAAPTLGMLKFLTNN